LGVLSAGIDGVDPQKFAAVCNIALEQFLNLEAANSEKRGEENCNSDFKDLKIHERFIKALSCRGLIDRLLNASC
jgi:hypothetical protein